MARTFRVAVRTLGCKVNQVESESIVASLVGRGAELADEYSADAIIINTCTVTGEADAKARKAVRHALALPQEPLVVVTGCLAAVDPEALQALGSRVLVLADKETVASRLAERAGLDAAAQPAPVRLGAGFHTRTQLKVQDGCDSMCAYCIVPTARGVPRSVAAAQAVAEAERLVAAGSREIVLTGINLGRFSSAGEDLASLVERIAATGVARVRLSSIEPLDVSERLLGVLAELPSFCRHLHVPLQSGDDALLSAMGRGYTTAAYARAIERARVALPGLTVTTDVLAGLPGEDDASAQRTLEFCEAVGFSRLHVFRYSARPGTRAAEMPDQVAPEARAERARRLRSLDARLREAHFDARRGSVAEVLVERRLESKGAAAPVAEGTTRDYLRVRVEGDGVDVGELVDVVLGGNARDVTGVPLG